MTGSHLLFDGAQRLCPSFQWSRLDKVLGIRCRHKDVVIFIVINIDTFRLWKHRQSVNSRRGHSEKAAPGILQGSYRFLG